MPTFTYIRVIPMRFCIRTQRIQRSFQYLCHVYDTGGFFNGETIETADYIYLGM